MAAKNLNRTQTGAQISIPVLPEKSEYLSLPTSPSTNVLMEVITSGKNIADLPARKKKVSHDSSYEVLENGNRRQINMASSSAKVTVELEDICAFAGSNKTAQKMFIMTLVKANEQALHDGVLTRDSISFPLQELVTLGMYTAQNNARRGFKDGVTALSKIKVSGSYKSGKSTVEYTPMSLIRFGKIDKGQCYVYLEPEFNWGSVTQFFTLIPQYYFGLPNKASELLIFICYMARQNVKEIAERGYFNISMRSVQQRLQLPSELNCREPAKLIRSPIEQAVAEIKAAQKGTTDKKGIDLELVYNPSDSVTEFLQNGYIKVKVSGVFAENFTALNARKEEAIEKKEQKRQRIAESAAAIRMAKGGGDEKN